MCRLYDNAFLRFAMWVNACYFLFCMNRMFRLYNIYVGL